MYRNLKIHRSGSCVCNVVASDVSVIGEALGSADGGAVFGNAGADGIDRRH